MGNLIMALIVFLSLLMVIVKSTATDSSWNQGRQFMLAFPQGYTTDYKNSLQLYISAKESCKVFIEAPAIGFVSNRTLHKGTTIVNLDNHLELKGPGTWRKGIYVSSDREIGIYAISQEHFSTDGFLVLPYTDMSNEYYVASYTPRDKSEFSFVATKDSTSVTITVKTNSGRVSFGGSSYSNGQRISLSLNRFFAAQVQHSHDLTGTRIESDKPITLISGNTCALIPHTQAACDTISEYIPPVHTWQKRYITARLKTRLHNRFRVISGSDRNHVKIGDIKTVALDAGQFDEEVINQDVATLIECSGPCLLAQFSEGTNADGKVGDPFMTLVPALGQFSSEYYFKTPANYVSHHLSIIIPATKAAGLRLDGAVVTGEQRTTFVNQISQMYSIIRLDISSSSHHLTHEGGEPFGAILYGFATTESYGFPLGITYLDISAVRLVNGTTAKSGQLEVSVGGVWKPVCSTAVDADVARVACRTLGYDKYSLHQHALQTVISSNVQHGLRNISCTGNEMLIKECSTPYYVPESCTGIAAIDCAPSLEELIYSRCTATSWDIAVDMDKLNYRLPGSLPEDIYLGENLCTGTMHGHQLHFKHDIHGCATTNTVTENDIIYSNQLVYAYHDPKYHFIIRNFNWTMDFNCHISRNQSGHSHVTYNQTAETSLNTLNSTSQYKIDTQFFLDPNFQQPTSGSPLRVPVGTNVFVKSFVSDVDWTVKMRLHSCYTATSAGLNESRYYLIQDGCEVDANTHLLSQTDHETKFVFQTFEMTGVHGDLYIRCEAVFCDTSDSTSSQQCDAACHLG